MNLIKSTIAAAAIAACCMGNEYPAQAVDMSPGEQHAFEAGYAYGWAYGLMTEGCLMLTMGKTSLQQFARTVEGAAKTDNLTQVEKTESF